MIITSLEVSISAHALLSNRMLTWRVFRSRMACSRAFCMTDLSATFDSSSATNSGSSCWSNSILRTCEWEIEGTNEWMKEGIRLHPPHLWMRDRENELVTKGRNQTPSSAPVNEGQREQMNEWGMDETNSILCICEWQRERMMVLWTVFLSMDFWSFNGFEVSNWLVRSCTQNFEMRRKMSICSIRFVNLDYVSGRLTNAVSHKRTSWLGKKCSVSKTKALIRSTGIIWETDLCKPWGHSRLHCWFRSFLKRLHQRLRPWHFDLSASPAANWTAEQHIFATSVWTCLQAETAENLLLCFIIPQTGLLVARRATYVVDGRFFGHFFWKVEETVRIHVNSRVAHMWLPCNLWKGGNSELQKTRKVWKTSNFYKGGGDH